MLTITSIFAVLLLIGMASAVSLNDSDLISQPTNVGHNDGTFTITFNLTNDGVAGDLYWDTSTLSHLGTFSFDKSTIGVGTEDYTATITFDSHQSGTITGTIGAGNTAGTADETIPFSVPITTSPSLEITGGEMATGTNTAIITLENTGNTYLSNLQLTSTGNFPVTLDQSTVSISAGQSRNVTITANADDLEDLVGSQTLATIKANNTDVSDTIAVVYEGEFCEYDELNSDLEIELEITGVEGLGDEDDGEFLPLDKVTFEVNIDNKGDSDIQDIELEWGVYNKETGEWFIEPEEEDTFDLDEDEDTTIEITFEIEDADDLDGENYALFVRATGEIDNSDNVNDGEKACVSASENMDIILEDDLIVVRNIDMPMDAFCGQDVEITAEIWNIGEDDQDDVVVTIYNTDLGISESVTFDEIDAFEKEEITLQFTIPGDADGDKFHYIIFDVRDDDGDKYEYDDDDLEYDYGLKLAGGCIAIPDITVTPTLVSEQAIAGDEVVISAEIENTGTEQHTFTISLDGLTGWAELVEIDKTTFLLPAGETETIEITLDVEKGIEGTESFTINAVSADGSAYTQPVSVEIEDTGFSLSDMFKGGNSLYWIVGAINVVLIIAIIIVVIRILSKKN